MNRKRNLIIFAVCAAFVLAGSYGADCRAAGYTAPVSSAASETVFTENGFECWSDKAEAKQILHDFVKNALDKNSAGYIPPENRVAVFDMDGTLISETNPFYLEWMMFIYRVLEDPAYQAPEEIKKYAEEVIKPAAYAQKSTQEMHERISEYQAKVYEGMSLDAFEKYVQNFLDHPVHGQSSLTYRESIYMPMRNVVDFLQSNGFKVYVVSGADRMTARTIASSELGIPKDQIIASDTAIAAGRQNNQSGAYCVLESGDQLVRSGPVTFSVINLNKATAIAKEIGMQPVLAFGTSSGDESMLLYTITNNKYPAEAFILMCDDVERDHGNAEKARSIKKLAEKDGFHAVSMKDDFKIIYPEKAKMVEITE